MAIVRSRCQEKLVLKERADLPECLDELVVFAERRGQKIMGFIDDQ